MLSIPVLLMCLVYTLPSIDTNALTISEKYSSVFEAHQSEGKFINLRKTTVQDLNTLTQMVIESDLAQFLGYGAETADVHDLVSLDSNSIDLVIEDDNKNIVGHITLSKGSNEKSINIGYWIGKNFRGKKYATQAVRNTINKIWEVDKTIEFEFWIDDENIASIRTLQKISEGFGINFENPGVLSCKYQLMKSGPYTIDILAEQNAENLEEYTIKCLINGILNSSGVTHKSKLLEDYSLEKIDSGVLLNSSTTQYLLKPIMSEF